MSRRLWIWGVILGALSGIAADAPLTYRNINVDIVDNFFRNFLSFLPGLIFGIFALGYFYFIRKSLIGWKSILWLAASSCSFAAAFFIAMTIAVNDAKQPTSQIGPFIGMGLAGFIGGLIVLLGFRLFISRIDIIHTAVFIIATTLIAAMPLWAIPIFGEWNFVNLFIPWQTAVLLITGHALHVARSGKEI